MLVNYDANNGYRAYDSRNFDYSLGLVQLLYKMGEILTDTDGTRYVKNDGTLDDKLICNASSHIKLNGTDQSIDIPLKHTLLDDSLQTATLGDDWTDNGDNSYTADDATSNLSDISSDGDCVIKFRISNYDSGTLYGKERNGIFYTIGDGNILDADGFTGDVEILEARVIDEVLVKSIIWFDYEDKEWKKTTDIPNLTEKNWTVSFSDLTLLGVITTDDDLTHLNANPDDVRKQWLNDDVNHLSFTKNDIFAIYTSSFYTESMFTEFVPNIIYKNNDTNTDNFDLENDEFKDSFRKGDREFIDTEYGRGVRYYGADEDDFRNGVLYTSCFIDNELYGDFQFVFFTVYAKSTNGTAVIKSVGGVLDNEYEVGTSFEKYSLIVPTLEGSLGYLSLYTDEGDDFIITNITVRACTFGGFAEIVNYTDSCRDDLKNTSVGSTDFGFVYDEHYSLDSESENNINSFLDGRFVTLPLKSPKDFLVTKDIKKIEGNTSKVTITYSDDSTEVVETE